MMAPATNATAAIIQSFACIDLMKSIHASFVSYLYNTHHEFFK